MTEQEFDKDKPIFLEGGSGQNKIPLRPLARHNLLNNKWSERMWPCMTWLIFLFNAATAASFIFDLFWLDRYDYAKHITIAVTMFASYFAVTWIHQNIVKADHYGRLD